MGEMLQMAHTHQSKEDPPLLENIPPATTPGPFGVIQMGGMFTLLKVREKLDSDSDPGWYAHPEGTVAEAIPLH